MLVIKNGDLLKATEDIICHQVNPDGIMGGGIALAIARKYPNCLKEYQSLCEERDFDYEELKGLALIVKVSDDLEIANCFSQDPDFNTDYDALREIFGTILEVCKRSFKTVAIPYNYGCGIANGDWNTVTEILEELSDMYQVDINIYKLED